jgi:hypothetical protein
MIVPKRGNRADVLWLLILGIACVLIAVSPRIAPLGLAAGLAGAIRPWARAWAAAEGTALRAALVWVAVAIGLGMVAQAVGLAETLESARPRTGRLTYLMVLAVLAALISVLGARHPGGGAWAILMVLLVVVFLIPWLELSARVRTAQGTAQLRLDSPWSLFYGVLVIAGVTNYLPTRYGPAAIVLGLGLVAEYLGLTRSGWSPLALARIWAFVAWSLGVSGWVTGWLASGRAPGADPIDRLWLWFRDHWGVVWALRTSERFNRTAEAAGWPLRLSWFGATSTAGPGGDSPEASRDQAMATLRNLLRRFATPGRLDALQETAPGAGGSPCHSGDGSK